MRLYEMKRLPRVRFHLPLRPRWEAAYDLGRYIKKPLLEHFGPVGMILGAFSASCVQHVDVEKHTVLIDIRRLPRWKCGPDEWRIRIDPYKFVVTPTVELEWTPAFQQVSDAIHACLISLPYIARICWYFQDWDMTQTGVRTPGELPWLEEKASV